MRDIVVMLISFYYRSVSPPRVSTLKDHTVFGEDPDRVLCLKEEWNRVE